MYSRRQFLRTGAIAAGALSFGPGFWRNAFAAPAQSGPGPYGPLGAPDANGIRLPEGFRSRVIARGNQPVLPTAHTWHIFSDGAATYATPDGGWILVSNSEVPVPGSGGAGAIRFAKNGSTTDAYPILEGTTTNCAGGATPWGTWMSCEEVETGRVWECDPLGEKPAVVRPAMGVFSHEALAVDPEDKRLYLTEDEGDSGFYRFTPESYPDCSRGLLEIASVQSNGFVKWIEVPDPSAASKPTRHQVPASTRFRRGEGIWFDSGFVYVVTTSDDKVRAYNATTGLIEVVYDGEKVTNPPLTDPDNLTVSRRSGDIFVCEDTGSFDMCVISPEGQAAKFLTLTGPEHGDPDSDASSELTGVVFDPSATRLYFSSQRAFVVGQIYEITGPFRTQRPPDRRAPGMRVVSPKRFLIRHLFNLRYPASVFVDEPVSVSATLQARLGPRSSATAPLVTLARTTRKLTKKGRADLRLAPASSARKRLRGRDSVSATLTIRARDRRGNLTVVRRPVRLLRSA